METKFEKGKRYKTVGGWEAEVIWVRRIDAMLVVIHKPGSEDESVEITHDAYGKAEIVLSVCEPPRYGQSHPADLIGE